MRILIVTDAWEPQVNGVVRTLQATVGELRAAGHEVGVISPDLFRSFPCPSYPEIRLAFAGWRKVGRHIRAFGPQAIHISTEGPLGLAARRWCIRNKFPFTTAYHTRFPEYVAARLPVSPAFVWRFIRWFHRPARHIMVATRSLARELSEQGLTQTMMWERGVDHELFRPDRAPHPAYAGLARPIQLYVGRVAVEKNIGAFLTTDRPGTKVIVGEGPALAELKAQHAKALFLGKLGGEALASAYSGADVFVFPSRTDTFGLVIIEAMSCGTPVAAYPVPGPGDIVTGGAGALDEDLGRAIDTALACDRADAEALGARYSWASCTAQFAKALTFVPSEPREAIAGARVAV
ncbi:alpha-mannosyltransferase [Sphingopyxis sp. H038]|uniref:glycosyltransferase family 4 protein n=1 Tax=unclassified Sphingopyxis TaxID=2614943 RepID=UPI000731E111|nr:MULTISPECIES: glycosyltransferase family 1 protein [unclassified Sphingopyxis]KTE01071.1 alpha-mannosyltransferase [Sphingopyxis sp. H012]KTE12418.1 alpha-mannosyltransferase [Sphingopyxis sp. H053]KTE14120.1 alpha-mannosyltransferase [Sphingopyxis sp. H093]KTE23669.1 alpha-mannosyltransferase [Sphingopyxis sp. H080]KTE32475.1 alpha-mannosyltransferase [Sphingopyxis sp. H038]